MNDATSEYSEASVARYEKWQPGPAWLFCPADRPDRYVKALSVADVVILDLEDAVAQSNKEAARAAVERLVGDQRFDMARTVLRINAHGTVDHRLDRALMERLGVPRVMLSKAELPEHVSELPGEVIPLVETARGVERAGTLAELDSVLGLMWGADDLVADMGGTASRGVDGPYREAVLYARSRTLIAAKSCGLLAIDAVHMDIADANGLRSECEDAVAVGFDATVAIHPSQVSVIREAYRPPAERVEWAQRLLDAVGDDAGVATFEGRMVDAPIYRQAKSVLRRHAAVGRHSTA